MLSIITTAATAAIVPASLATQIIGATLPPYPAGTDDSNGSCIGETLETMCDVSIGTLIDVDAKPLVVYAGRSKGHQPDGKAIWLVTDAMAYPAPSEGNWFAISSCRLDGQEDAAIVAMADSADTEFLKVRSWAFKLDRDSGKFLKLDPAKVDCYNTAIEAD